MTAENLHDALNLLPSDLLTATDKLRRAPRTKTVPWIRVVSLAACVAVVICGSFFMWSPLRNKAAMAEPMMQQSVAEAPAAAAPMAPYPVEGEVAADELHRNRLMMLVRPRFLMRRILPWKNRLRRVPQPAVWQALRRKNLRRKNCASITATALHKNRTER